MRIGADTGEGEFDHVGLGDDDRAGGAQTAHDRRVGRGRQRFLGEGLGTGAGRLAGHVKQILDADDGAVERPERNAERRARVCGIRRRPRRFGIDRQARALSFPVRLGDAE